MIVVIITSTAISDLTPPDFAPVVKSLWVSFLSGCVRQLVYWITRDDMMVNDSFWTCRKVGDMIVSYSLWTHQQLGELTGHAMVIGYILCGRITKLICMNT